MTSPSNFLYTMRDTAGRAADALAAQIKEAQEVLDHLNQIADDAEAAAELVAASDIEPDSVARIPERSGLVRPDEPR